MKSLLTMSFLFCLVSCGSLKLSPGGCKSPGFWGSAALEGNESRSSVKQELEFSEEYYVFALDKDIKLRDFLKEKGVDCSEVKKMRVQMSSTFFIKRKLRVTIAK